MKNTKDTSLLAQVAALAPLVEAIATVIRALGL